MATVHAGRRNPALHVSRSHPSPSSGPLGTLINNTTGKLKCALAPGGDAAASGGCAAAAAAVRGHLRRRGAAASAAHPRAHAPAGAALDCILCATYSGCAQHIIHDNVSAHIHTRYYVVSSTFHRIKGCAWDMQDSMRECTFRPKTIWRAHSAASPLHTQGLFGPRPATQEDVPAPAAPLAASSDAALSR